MRSLVLGCLAAMALTVRAEMISTSSYVEAQTAQRQSARRALQRQGVDAEQAALRAQALSAHEAGQVAAGADALPAGGNVVLVALAAYTLVRFAVGIACLALPCRRAS